MPDLSLYALALLACPLGMGLMMWLMMRGNKDQPSTGGSDHQQAEMTRMRAEIDELRPAGQDHQGIDGLHRPAP